MLSGVLGDAWTSNEEGNVYVFFNATALAWWESVLIDVVFVVSCVNQLRVL